MPFLPAIGLALAAIGDAVGVAAGALVAGLGGGLVAGTLVDGIVSLAVPSIIEFGALAGVSALLAPRPHLNVRGSPQSTKYDPLAPVPMVMGRYGVGGNVVYRTTSGGSNKAQNGAAGNEFLTEFNILSGLGPIKSIDTLRFDDTVLTFSQQNVTGGYIESEFVQSYNPGYKLGGNGTYQNDNFKDHAWQNTQLGATPSPPFLYPNKINDANDDLPEWTSAMGFSSLAASALTIVYDVGTYAGGVPQKQWVVEGYSTYDPRLDGTYPGGSGPARWLGQGASASTLLAARATWAYSQNPIIHALNYALGYYLPDAQTGPGRLYAGIGAGLNGVDVAAFVAAANVADANGWIGAGQWTTGDGKWSVLTAMLQAGGATPINDRGRISCMVSTPRTSLGTITSADLAGDITLDTGASMRERINTVYPSYTSEPHRWQIVQADTPIKPATYIAEDGGFIRSKSLTFEYVPAVNQACQLAAYAIADGREIPAIQLIGKPHLRNYAVGDCLTVDIPEAGLGMIKVVVVKRATSIATGMVTLTCRSETDAKHAYCLGISGVAPATPMISGYDPSIVPAPLPAQWSAAPASSTDPATGAVTHVISINGSAVDNLYATTVVVSYAPVTVVSGNDVIGAYASQTFAASVTQINLKLAPGRWHVQLHYIIVSGAEAGADGILDLGTITVPADTAATAVVAQTLPGSSTFGDAAASVASTLQRITTVEQNVSQIQTQDNSQAIANLNTQVNNLNTSVNTLDGDVSLTNPSSNSIGAAVVAAQSSISYLNNNTVSLSTYNGLVAQIGPAGTAGTILARVGTLETATTGPSNSLATRTSALEADVGSSGDSPSSSGSLFARVASISSAQAGSGYATAQSVSDLRAALTPGGPNLVPNPTFGVVDATGAPVNWTLVGGAARGVDPHMGACLEVPASADGVSIYSDFFPAGASVYSLQAQLNDVFDTGQLGVNVEWWSASAVLQGSTALVQSGTSDWTLHTAPNLQAPGGTTRARIQVEATGANSGVAGAARIKLEIGPVCTLYADDGISSSISTLNEATANALTGKASSTDVASLTSTITDPATGLAKTRADLTTLQQTVVSTYATVSYVQSLSTTVVIGPNLVPDGGFALSAAGAPGGWTFYSNCAAQSSEIGNRLITGTGAYNAASPSFPVAAGPYTISARLTRYDTGGEQSVRLVYPDGTVSAAIPSPAEFDTLQTLTVQVPSGYASARVQIIGNCVQTNHQVQEVKVEPGNNATPFIDSATAAVLSANIVSASNAYSGPLGALTTQTNNLTAALTPSGTTGNPLPAIAATVASVSTNAAALVTLENQAYATYGVTVNANGHLAGFKLVSASGNAPVSAFEVDASNFLVVTPSGATMSFSDGPSGTGRLVVNSLLIGTDELGASAVTEFSFWLNSYNGYLTNQGGGGGTVSTPAPPTSTAPPSGGGGSRGATP